MDYVGMAWDASEYRVNGVNISGGLVNAQVFAPDFDSDSSNNSTALSDAATAAGLVSGIVDMPSGTYNMVGTVSTLSGVRELRGQGSENTILDFSGRSSAVSSGLIKSQGSLSTSTNLTVNAAYGDEAITVADVSAFVVGDYFLLRSSHTAYPNSQQTDGEWHKVKSINTGAKILTLEWSIKEPYGYATSDTSNACKVNTVPPIHFKGMTIIGTGQQFTSTGTVDGDAGLAVLYGEYATFEDVRFIDCNYNSVRINNCIESEVEDLWGEVADAESADETQYPGTVLIGASNRHRSLHINGKRGRHNVFVHVSGGSTSGKAFDTVVRDSIGEAANGAVCAEHDGAINVTYDGITARGHAGNGFDLRGRQRKVVNCTITDLYGSGDGRGIILRNDASDILVDNCLFDEVRYIVKAEHTDAAPAGFGDNSAPGDFTFSNNICRHFENGVVFTHTGAANEVASGYNVTVAGPIRIRNNDFICSPATDGAGTCNTPVKVNGYYQRLECSGNNFEYPVGITTDYAVTALGVSEVILDDRVYKNTLGVSFGSASVLDAAGAGATRTPTLLALIDEPVLIDHAGEEIINTVLSASSYTKRLPPRRAVGLATSGTSSSNTKTALATIPILGGRMGKNGSLQMVVEWSHTNSGNNKTLSVEFGGHVIFSTVVTTTDVTRAFLFMQNNNSLAIQVAGPTDQLSFGSGTTAVDTSAIDTSADQNLIVYGQCANAGESIILKQFQVDLQHSW